MGYYREERKVTGYNRDGYENERSMLGISLCEHIQSEVDKKEGHDHRISKSEAPQGQILHKLVGWVFGFYGISTFVGYLTPDPFL